MAKAVKEYDLVLNDSEVKLVRDTTDAAIHMIVRQHFTDKGMTQDEIDKKIKFGRIWEETEQAVDECDILHCYIRGIKVEVTEKLD